MPVVKHSIENERSPQDFAQVLLWWLTMMGVEDAAAKSQATAIKTRGCRVSQSCDDCLNPVTFHNALGNEDSVVLGCYHDGGHEEAARNSHPASQGHEDQVEDAQKPQGAGREMTGGGCVAFTVSLVP